MLSESALAEAGFTPTPVGPDALRLTRDGQSATVTVARFARAPRPSELLDWLDRTRSVHAGDGRLVAAPHLSARSRELLKRASVGYATEDGHVHVPAVTPRLDDGSDAATATGDEHGSRSPADDGRPLPFKGRSAYQVIRRVLQLGPGHTQTEIAAAAFVSQPRVSQVASTLRRLGHLNDDGTVTDPERLLDEWLTSYPGPGGTGSAWFGTQDVWSQVTAACSHLPVDAHPVVSGDPAADQLAPWREPTTARIYVTTGADLSALGLVAAPDPSGATLELVSPADPTVRPHRPLTRRHGERDVSLADPVQVLWDVRARLPQPEHHETIALLRTSVLDRWMAV